jgi:hypothetical protein
VQCLPSFPNITAFYFFFFCLILWLSTSLFLSLSSLTKCWCRIIYNEFQSEHFFLSDGWRISIRYRGSPVFFLLFVIFFLCWWAKVFESQLIAGLECPTDWWWGSWPWPSSIVPVVIVSKKSCPHEPVNDKMERTKKRSTRFSSYLL